MRIGRPTRGRALSKSREGQRSGCRREGTNSVKPTTKPRGTIPLQGFLRGCLIPRGRNLPQGADHAGGRHISWRTLDRKTKGSVRQRDLNVCRERPTMKALQIERFGSPTDVVKAVDIPDVGAPAAG